MISIVSRSMCATAASSFCPAYPPSANSFGERGKRVAGSFDQARSTVAVLNIGAVHHAFQHVAECVGHDMPLAPFDLLAGVVSPRPTASVVFTDWLSMMPAVGAGSRPSDTRTHATSTALMTSSRPLSRIR